MRQNISCSLKFIALWLETRFRRRALAWIFYQRVTGRLLSSLIPSLLLSFPPQRPIRSVQINSIFSIRQIIALSKLAWHETITDRERARCAFTAFIAFASKRNVKIKFLTWNRIEPAETCYKFLRWKNEEEGLKKKAREHLVLEHFYFLFFAKNWSCDNNWKSVLMCILWILQKVCGRNKHSQLFQNKTFFFLLFKLKE